MILFIRALVMLGVVACGRIPESLAQVVDQTEPVPHIYREIDGQELKAFLFSPPDSLAAQSPLGAVLLFHGGGWSVGTPEWTFAAAQRFAAKGMIAISVQYRLSEGEITPIDALADVCASFSWARANAEELKLDPDRVAGYGVSAGGHLVASAATVGCPVDESATERPEPDLLLLWSPALDMARDGWFGQKLGGRATAGAYSPVEHVRISTPPTSIVQGSADTLTPLSGAERFCARMVELNGTCELNVYDGVGHLLTPNLANQESDFDPDPEAVADGIEQHFEFLRTVGFLDSK